ncbi:MAG: hypothetical protein DI537_42705 [Stutzerimonas stutzeri]|nr:MAG: hypothetical protein DI537_42705 [Stutzerimonas stutzeri]
MTVIRHEGKLQVTCDSCPTTYRRTYKEEDFKILLADITAEEWKKFRVGDDWHHRCPDCATSTERRML